MYMSWPVKALAALTFSTLLANSADKRLISFFFLIFPRKLEQCFEVLFTNIFTQHAKYDILCYCKSLSFLLFYFKKLLSYELDVQVGIYEAKYHRDELMNDRKTLSEELKSLKESLDDNGPPSKVQQELT